MTIYKDGTWTVGADDSDFSGGSAAYVLPDSSELAGKIMSISGSVRLITDDSGQLIDAQPITDRKAEIYARLCELDLAAVRPLRALAAGTATDTDRERLAELEAQAAALRQELQKGQDNEHG